MQHPDRYCVSAISLAAHLTGLCVAIEHSGREAELNVRIQRWLSGRPSLVQPRLPAARGRLTIADVRAAETPAAHREVTERWARETWDAYRDVQPLARSWIQSAVR